MLALIKNCKNQNCILFVCVRGAGVWTFETHVTWGWALIGLFQIVRSAPKTLPF